MSPLRPACPTSPFSPYTYNTYVDVTRTCCRYILCVSYAHTVQHEKNAYVLLLWQLYICSNLG